MHNVASACTNISVHAPTHIIPLLHSKDGCNGHTKKLRNIQNWNKSNLLLLFFSYFKQQKPLCTHATGIYWGIMLLIQLKFKQQTVEPFLPGQQHKTLNNESNQSNAELLP